MALRVLLADNSETIKKVIQLTLQDFSVDLRIVASGLDVIDVVEKFKPDIIFVDILLQKKSGYDVARELKTHPSLGSIPVILMWSGFMDFDEERAANTLVDARLEKPFDAKTLRDLVSKFVSKTKSNSLSNFLDFPTLPPMDESRPIKSKSKDPLDELQKIKEESLKFAQNIKAQEKVEIVAPTSEETLPDLDLDLRVELENQDDFEMKPLSDSNSNMDVGSFKLELPDDVSGDEDFAVNTNTSDKIDDMSFLLNPEEKKVPISAKPVEVKPVTALPTPPPLPAAQTTSPNLTLKAPSKEEIEKIVLQGVQEAVEKIVWQIVPEMASQMIRKELERLLKDKDSNL